MKVFYTPEKKNNLSIALGFFDGLHKGHKKVICAAIETAKELNIKSAVVSFSNHPNCILLKKKPEYILPLEDKISILDKLGVDYLYLLDFNQALSEMPKEKYFKLNAKFESDKNLLIKLRKTTNKLKMQLDKLTKKDELYNELYEKNKNLIQENELLYNKLVENEEIRNEQEKLIKALQNEVLQLREQNINI